MPHIALSLIYPDGRVGSAAPPDEGAVQAWVGGRPESELEPARREPGPPFFQTVRITPRPKLSPGDPLGQDQVVPTQQVPCSCKSER